MWLDRDTAAKCYMLSARKLCIFSGDTPRYWRWIPLTDSRSVCEIKTSIYPQSIYRLVSGSDANVN